jgi:hypothetical protein
VGKDANMSLCWCRVILVARDGNLRVKMEMHGGGARGRAVGGGGRSRSSYRMTYVPSFFSTSYFIGVEIF